MAAGGVLEQPAGLRGVAGPDQQLRQLELHLGGVVGDAAQVADRSERRLAVAVRDRLLYGLASRLGALLVRGTGQGERDSEDHGLRAGVFLMARQRADHHQVAVRRRPTFGTSAGSIRP
jgi:hypothetical protein